MRRTVMVRTILIAGAAALAFAAGCASTAPPTRAKTETVAAVRSAREVGAMNDQRAAYHLELAEEQLVRADSLIEAGRMDDATRMLARAKSDAELAIVLTRESAIEAEAEALDTRIQAMRERL